VPGSACPGLPVAPSQFHHLNASTSALACSRGSFLSINRVSTIGCDGRRLGGSRPLGTKALRTMAGNTWLKEYMNAWRLCSMPAQGWLGRWRSHGLTKSVDSMDKSRSGSETLRVLIADYYWKLATGKYGIKEHGAYGQIQAQDSFRDRHPTSWTRQG